MKLTTVGTGSDGNCYLIESNNRYTVLDCGMAWKSVLVACGFNVAAIDFGLCTHGHSDHSKRISDFVRNGIPIYANKETADATLNSALFAKPNFRHKQSGWTFIPFNVPHTNTDGSECENYAFIIERNGEKLLYLTDWMFCPYVLAKFNINHFLIAVNYTDLSDMEESANHVLKGHASLDTAVKFLESSMTDACKSISVCHVSTRNADENLILERLQEVAGEHVNVNICKKGETITL